MKKGFALGPDGVLRAVERAGFVPSGHCTPLTCLENRVYDVRLEDGRHVVVKFYRPGRWPLAAILEEHAFLADLAAADVPVCAPLVPSEARGTVLEHEGMHYAIWPRTGGRSPDELDDTAIAVLGRLLARIHNVGAVGNASHRPRIDAATRVAEPLSLLEQGGFLPPSCTVRYCAAAEALAEHYEALSEGVPVHRIHGDCHLGNLLQRDGTWFFLDFDDFAVGPAVQDVWMLLPGRDAEAGRQRALLLDAYRQFRDFAPGWLRLVEPLRGLRFVWYAGWIARRWDDPVFPDAFPHFGSEAYWEGETRDLEEQLARVEREARGEGAPEEPALRNEDYFFDL